MPTQLYGVFDDVPEEIPAGHSRISLVTDTRTRRGFYQVEHANGEFYLCDADGDVIQLREWMHERTLADIPTDDTDAFFEAIETTAKRIETS